MTPKQTALYWREWAKVRKADPEALSSIASAPEDARHALHARALGSNKSSKDFTNADLDKVLSAFRAISKPDDLNAQIDLANQDRKRLIYRIHEMAHPAYWRKISENKFGSIDLDTLTTEQLTQLRNTLVKRNQATAAKDRAERQPARLPSDLSSVAPSGAKEEALCEGGSENPF